MWTGVHVFLREISMVYFSHAYADCNVNSSNGHAVRDHLKIYDNNAALNNSLACKIY